MTLSPRSVTEPPAAAWTFVLCARLVAATLLAYAPSIGHDFVLYDDDEYVVLNETVRRGLTPEGIRWAFTTGYAANWHPLTWLSHMLDVEIHGMWAGGH